MMSRTGGRTGDGHDGAASKAASHATQQSQLSTQPSVKSAFKDSYAEVMDAISQLSSALDRLGAKMDRNVQRLDRLEGIARSHPCSYDHGGGHPHQHYQRPQHHDDTRVYVIKASSGAELMNEEGGVMPVLPSDYALDSDEGESATYTFDYSAPPLSGPFGTTKPPAPMLRHQSTPAAHQQPATSTTPQPAATTTTTAASDSVSTTVAGASPTSCSAKHLTQHASTPFASVQAVPASMERTIIPLYGVIDIMVDMTEVFKAATEYEAMVALRQACSDAYLASTPEQRHMLMTYLNEMRAWQQEVGDISTQSVLPMVSHSVAPTSSSASVTIVAPDSHSRGATWVGGGGGVCLPSEAFGLAGQLNTSLASEPHTPGPPTTNTCHASQRPVGECSSAWAPMASPGSVGASLGSVEGSIHTLPWSGGDVTPSFTLTARDDILGTTEPHAPGPPPPYILDSTRYEFDKYGVHSVPPQQSGAITKPHSCSGSYTSSGSFARAPTYFNMPGVGLTHGSGPGPPPVNGIATIAYNSPSFLHSHVGVAVADVVAARAITRETEWLIGKAGAYANPSVSASMHSTSSIRPFMPTVSGLPPSALAGSILSQPAAHCLLRCEAQPASASSGVVPQGIRPVVKIEHPGTSPPMHSSV
jgi:hypothetical protein